MRRMLAILAATVAVLVAASGPALAADDYLDFSDPAPRQQLDRVPGWVTLVFKTEASATLAKIVVQDAAGGSVASGPRIVEGTNVTTQLKSGLTKGTYTVYYRTSDADGQPRGGAFQFSYGKGNWTDINVRPWIGESAEPTVIAEKEPTETPTTEPSGPETYTPAPTATATVTSPSPTPSAAPPAGPWIGLGAVLLAVAGVGGWLLWRRRSTPSPRRVA